MDSSNRLIFTALVALVSAGAFGEPAPRSPEGAELQVIGEYIRGHGAAISDCYSQRLDFNPRLRGRLMLRFEIGGDGKVLRPTVEGIPDRPLGDCVLAEMETWQFPKPPPGEVVRVAYPINFKPPA